MAPMYDLHVHSCYSDGVYDLPTLVQLAKEKNLLGLSFTDHDSIEAYKSLKGTLDPTFRILSGVELSTYFLGVSVHVLAYGFATHSDLLHKLCEKQKHSRLARTRYICFKLQEIHNIKLSFEDVQKLATGCIGRPHIARALKEAGVVEDEKEAFEKFLGEGKSCYVPLEEPLETEKAIEIIQKEAAFAVLAHPHCFKEHRIVERLLYLPFDGLECYYGNFLQHRERPFLKLAKKHRLLITGGSDFHQPSPYGRCIGASWTNEETFDMLYHRFLENECRAKI